MSTPDSTSAEMVRVAREKLGETQAVFAARFGVDQTTVHLWERNGLPRRGTARVAVERLLAELADKEAPSTAPAEAEAPR